MPRVGSSKMKNARPGGEPLADDDFLLIAAAQKPRQPARSTASRSAAARSTSLATGRRGARAVPAAGKQPAQAGDQQVVLRPTASSASPSRLAVLRAPARRRRARHADRLRRAIGAPFSCTDPPRHAIGAENRARELACGRRRPDRRGPRFLPRARSASRLRRRWPHRRSRTSRTTSPGCSQNRSPIRRLTSPPDHQLDELVARSWPRRRHRRHVLPIAQHGDAIADRRRSPAADARCR